MRRVERAFRSRLRKTFNISEEGNEDFWEETDGRVRNWVRDNDETLKPLQRVESIDTPEVSAWLINDILNDFNKRAPGP